MIDLSRLLEAFKGALTLKDDIIAAVEPHVPAELVDDWQAVKDAANDPANLEAANAAIAEGLAGALKAVLDGHGPVGPPHGHMG